MISYEYIHRSLGQHEHLTTARVPRLLASTQEVTGVAPSAAPGNVSTPAYLWPDWQKKWRSKHRLSSTVEVTTLHGSPGRILAAFVRSGGKT